LSNQNNDSVVKLNQEVALMDKLSEPEQIEQLISLLDKVEKFNALFESMEHFIARGPEMADSLNRLVVSMREEIPNAKLISDLQNSLETLSRIQKFLNTEEFKQLEANLANEKTLKMLNVLARSITEASSEIESESSGRISIFTLMREVSNPEIQPAIQFVLNLAKILSKEIKNA